MENIYELLELEIDPRPRFQDVNEIKAAIEAKKRKYSQKATGAQQAKYEQKIKELQAFAGDITMDKMNAAYEEAKSNVKQCIEDTFKYVVINNEITEERANSIAKDNKVTVQFLLWEFPNIHLKVDAVKELEIPKCKNKMNDQIKNQLLVVKKENLYDFLNYHGAKGTLSQFRMKEAKELQDIAKTLAGEFDKNADLTVKSAGAKLAALCQDIFKDRASKEDYDLYLNRYAPLSAILNRVGALAENSTLLPQTGEKLIAEMNAIVRNTDESRRYLRWKCKTLNINWTEVPDTSIANCIFCGGRIGVTDQVCGHCGKKQFVVCKKCGAKSRADSKFCTSCSENFGDVKKAAEYCDAALAEIRELNFDVARHFISRAEMEGGDAEEIEKAKTLLKKTEKEVGTQVAQLEDCRKAKAYYKAEKLLHDIQKMYPGYQNERLEKIIKDALTNAKHLFDKASSTSRESECLEFCDQIELSCSDYPGIDDLRDKFPPETPCSIVVKIHNERKTIDILWDYKGVAAGIQFVVVRKEYAKPVSAADGEVIGKFSSRSCTDRNPEAGREYYYAVFACRGNRFSKAGTAKDAAVCMYDVENAAIHPGDGVVQIQWIDHTNGNVRIWRKENDIPQKPGDGTEVVNLTSTGVWDNNVANEHSYGYLICTEYTIGGTVYYSAGIKLKAMPEPAPQPVTYLISEISESNRQLFRLEWDDDITDTVKFYGSSRPLEWGENSIIERAQLETVAAVVNVTVTEPGKGTFNIGTADEMYITAVTAGKENCIIGACAYVSNRQIFNIKETRLVHGDLHIFLDEWPKDCNTLKIVWRSDAYPRSVNDKEAEKLICTKSMYNQSKTIILRNIAQHNYYISIFGKLAGDKGYAAAVNTVFSNEAKIVISYELIVKKGLLGKISDVQLAFTSSEGAFKLPALYVYKNRGFLPPNMSVGEKVKEIGPTGETSWRHVFSMGKGFSRDEYVKVFFKNSQDVSLYELNAVSGLSI